MINSIGGRKLVAAAVVLVVGAGAVILKGDIPPNMLQLLQTLFGALVLGNVAEHAGRAYVQAKEAQAGGSEEDVVDTIEELNASLSARMDALEAKANTTLETTAVVQQGVQAIVQIAQGVRHG